MKTIGLIGGMSWESTREYYRVINETVKDRLGGHHSAELVIYSIDFANLSDLPAHDDWAGVTRLLTDAARRVAAAGADFLLLGANTVHRVADEVGSSAGIPLLHIADATADAVKKQGLRKVALLGTRFTMEQGFYRERLQERHGLEVITPEKEERDLIHDVIFNELSMGVFRESSREAYRRIMAALASRGAQGIILGCTEIPLLVTQADAEVPLFDTTTLHARTAVDWALS